MAETPATSPPGAPGAPGTPGAPAEYRLTVLSGHRPAHVLACWGLTSLLPGAALRFEGDWAVPVLTWGGDAGALAGAAAEALVAVTWDLGHRSLRGIKTTTPSRTGANALSAAAWEASGEAGSLVAADVLQTFDLSASKSGKGAKADIQVRAAALTLFSGKSYTAKSVQDTWLLLDANTPEAARTTAAVEIEWLLDGRLHVVEAQPGLRFSANHPTPRVTSGSEKCDVHPLIDLLAFCGQLLLQPAQRPLTSSALRKEFTWVLNPVPLTAPAIVDIHESPPERLPWPRWSSPIRATGGSAKVSFLAPAKEERPTDIRGGSRA